VRLLSDPPLTTRARSLRLSEGAGTGGDGTATASGQTAAGGGTQKKRGGCKQKEGEDSEGQTQYVKRRRILFRTLVNVTHACTGAHFWATRRTLSTL